MSASPLLEPATFAAGCFWKVEAAFRQLPGVEATSVGYMGGHWPNPSYLDVVARVTGHAEVARVEFDPQRITYAALLETFWDCHDPTSLNRQGADRGEQYRSVIFYHTPDQESTARRSKLARARSQRYDKEIVTLIQPASDYYLATEEHQQYFEKQLRQKLSRVEPTS